MMSRQERITSMALIWEISSNRTGLWWGISGGQAKQLQFNFKHLVTCPHPVYFTTSHLLISTIFLSKEKSGLILFLFVKYLVPG